MKILLTGSFLLLAACASAQGPIIIDATTKLVWDVTTPDAATAQSLTYKASVDGGAATTLTPVVCVAGVAPLFTCATPISQIPLGSHTVVLTSGTATATSGPSAPFAYIDLLIPVPTNLRAK